MKANLILKLAYPLSRLLLASLTVLNFDRLGHNYFFYNSLAIGNLREKMPSPIDGLLVAVWLALAISGHLPDFRQLFRNN